MAPPIKPAIVSQPQQAANPHTTTSSVAVEDHSSSESASSGGFLRKTSTLGYDAFVATITAKHLLNTPDSITWVSRLYYGAKTGGTTLPAAVTNTATNAVSRFGTTRLGQWASRMGNSILAGFLSKIPILNKLPLLGKLGGRTIPVIGTALVLADVGTDCWRGFASPEYGGMEGAGDVIAGALKKANIGGIHVTKARELASVDLSDPANASALREHLITCGIKDADAVVEKARIQGAAKTERKWDAGVNVACTALGGVIGFCCGGPAGAVLGMAIGNLAATGINMLRKSFSTSGVGSFFKSFFS